MHVQEYPEASAGANAGRVYLGYLDSVYYFQPKELRTRVYHACLSSYLEYTGAIGYKYCHIWACPPWYVEDVSACFDCL